MSVPAQEPAGLPDWLDDIHEFVNELRRADFRIGVREEVRAVQVLDYLRGLEVSSRSPNEMADWLGPVFCTSARQQQSFREHLQRWAEKKGGRTESVAQLDLGKKPSLPSNVAAVQRAAGTDRRLMLLGIGSGALLLAIAARYLPSAESFFDHLPSVQLSVPTLEPTQIEVFSRLVLGVVPLGLLFAFLSWYRRRPQALARGFTARATPTRKVAFEAAARMLFRAIDLSRHFQVLRRHHEVPSFEIDVRRSLRATLRAGGRVSFQYGTRRRLPDYLLLVDRMSTHDHLVAIADLLARRLTEEQVPYTRYDFNGDPRRARLHAPGVGDGTVAELADLAALHGNHPLILLTDTERFFAPFSDQPQFWVSALLSWPLVLILMPKPREEWGLREQTLQSMGFVLIPATSAGIASFADLLLFNSREPAPIPAIPTTPRLWQMLGARPDRWLSNSAPPKTEIAQLMDALAQGLGPRAFEVLCAIAVFPVVRAEVTLWLADRLRRGDTSLLDEQAFGQLARLPWLRRGKLPDWLRLGLIDKLSPAQQAEVRQLCFNVLQPRGSVGEGFELDMAWRDQPIWLATLLAVLRQDDESTLHDIVFLSFVRGERVSPLELPAQEDLGRLLRPKLSLVEWTGVALAFVVSPLLFVEGMRVASFLATVLGPERLLGVAIVLLMIVIWRIAAIRNWYLLRLAMQKLRRLVAPTPQVDISPNIEQPSQSTPGEPAPSPHPFSSEEIPPPIRAPGARRLIVCMDGTWVKPSQKDEGVRVETNVLKLSSALAKLPDQIVAYFHGVGTDYGEKVRGGVFGWGLFNQIKDGYRFLREQFQPGDQIYIFGFSRGAYSARRLAGMVLRCGIIRRDAKPMFPDLGIDLLTTQEDGNLRMDVVDRVFALYNRAYEQKNRPEVEGFKRQYSHDTTVRFVGVWETVGALGIPSNIIPLLERFDQGGGIDEKGYGFLDTDLSPRVEAAYHAVAIDEHRRSLLPTLWTDPRNAPPRINVAGSNVEQVWFVGAHSNVGGGYADTGLSDIALKWMIERATKNGLKFEPAALAALRPTPLAKRRDSLDEFIELGRNRFLAWIDGIATKLMAVDRAISDGSWVHDSVSARLAAATASEPDSNSAYSPAKTLKTTQTGGVRSVDPRSLRVVS